MNTYFIREKTKAALASELKISEAQLFRAVVQVAHKILKSVRNP